MKVMKGISSFRQALYKGRSQGNTKKELEGSQRVIMSFENELEESKELLSGYKDCLEACQRKIEDLSATEEDQMAAVQVALDLTYIKEAVDEMAVLQKEITEEIGKLDTTIIEPIKKNYTANRNATVKKLDEILLYVKAKNRGMKVALIISIVVNLLCAGGVGVLLLHMYNIL
ncbi:MAG: hypothetical protein K6G65_07010 [Lachnospiraceae bacterium]|nr:hypothetical protein [Lachnospiraceae bacterium]